MVKVDLHTKYQGRRSNDSGVRVLTDRQTDGRYQVHYLPTSLSYTVDKKSKGIYPILICKSQYKSFIWARNDNRSSILSISGHCHLPVCKFFNKGCCRTITQHVFPMPCITFCSLLLVKMIFVITVNDFTLKK